MPVLHVVTESGFRRTPFVGCTFFVVGVSAYDRLLRHSVCFAPHSSSLPVKALQKCDNATASAKREK